MKTLTAEEAYEQIISGIKWFQKETIGKYKTLTVKVENVSFVDFVILTRLIKEKKKSIFLPGEVGTECMVMVIIPAPGCIIEILSEPCVNYKFKGVINYN